MYPTFTGSAKSRRQVNLSGRNSNPFAAYGSPKPSTTTQTAHNPAVQAQQKRILREQERQRPPAAINIQRTWRGHRSRNESREIWRQQWDVNERLDTPGSSDAPYKTSSECLEQLRLLAQFASPRSEEDIQRILRFASRASEAFRNEPLADQEAWVYATYRLAKTVTRILNRSKGKTLPTEIVTELLYLLGNLSTCGAPFMASQSLEYYESLSRAAGYCKEALALQSAVTTLINDAGTNEQNAYEGFAWAYLTQEHLPGFADHSEELSRSVKYNILANALEDSLETKSNQELSQSKKNDGMLWLLSRFIFYHRCSAVATGRPNEADAQFVKIVSKLIFALADGIGRRIDAVDLNGTQILNSEAQALSAAKLPDFVRSQILSLVSQESVTGLLTKLEADRLPTGEQRGYSTEASALASYVLTLLRVFPKRRSDIQLWLYRGSADRQKSDKRSLPATKYFYQAASSTHIFRSISNSPKQAVLYLAPNRKDTLDKKTRDQEWQVILLFLELYIFILQVMDDEEFLSGTSDPSPGASWTKQSALQISDVAHLSVFLKNLAFALYWDAAEIAGEDRREENQSLSAYFGKVESRHENPNEGASVRVEERDVAGVSGMTVNSLKGVVVGVLRMIYQRDSRRKFFSKNHWLMTKDFEMDRFISAVVEEEEQGRLIEESYEETDDPISRSFAGMEEGHDDDTYNADENQLVGTQRVQNLRNMERLKSQQRKASKRKYLESVTPRLRILENMPFFIPFHTRVQIFRQFVALDQHRRRGTADADEWRYAMMNSPTGNISRHRATVRREHIFDDAYSQYYDLGEGLKEPIQIRFVDQFDTVEEGIDGGGVTKEFLTSVTNEAFGATNGLESLFVANDQHLLYPNPATVEERKETMRQMSFKEGSPDWNENVRDLLRRYEFLGRVVGKCLYEGILVDLHFAPFFLLKWALTGGSGSGSKETGYRANLNDLRDLDEGFYQGLLNLKNYPGNVQEDFGLDFTINETLRLSPTQEKTITRDLRPDGSKIAVTNENRLVYIASVARHRLQSQPYQQTSAFLKGLGTIISPSWLSMFNQSELQTLIGGSGSEVSISDLRANTQYGGVYVIGDDNVEHPSIELFWKVMQDLSPEDVAKVLKFVTSTPRAPLLGFGNLNPRFSIRDSGSDQTRLPSTSTCVNLLKLPIYRDEKTLRERLLYSVNSGAGFNLS